MSVRCLKCKEMVDIEEIINTMCEKCIKKIYDVNRQRLLTEHEKQKTQVLASLENGPIDITFCNDAFDLIIKDLSEIQDEKIKNIIIKLENLKNSLFEKEDF